MRDFLVLLRRSSDRRIHVVHVVPHAQEFLARCALLQLRALAEPSCLPPFIARAEAPIAVAEAVWRLRHCGQDALERLVAAVLTEPAAHAA